ncbi:MAG TPA: Rrf2 family transcriptional regulator [Bryobacteraceae bacterium]|nr:Rrf2 family transcriptional regulator [Bryobacteraceae bacterium]
MLKLSRKADYGLISLKHIAMKRSSASAREIAESYGIPLPLLAKVLQRLARTGFLQSENGANGGYRLRKRASEISALEVIRTIDGPVFLTSCATGTHRECGVSDRCNVREPLRKIHDGIEHLLGSLSIADMCEESAEDSVPACGTSSAVVHITAN